jgi:hypothetical protein
VFVTNTNVFAAITIVIVVNTFDFVTNTNVLAANTNVFVTNTFVFATNINVLVTITFVSAAITIVLVTITIHFENTQPRSFSLLLHWHLHTFSENTFRRVQSEARLITPAPKGQEKVAGGKRSAAH